MKADPKPAAWGAIKKCLRLAAWRSSAMAALLRPAGPRMASAMEVVRKHRRDGVVIRPLPRVPVVRLGSVSTGVS
jgi:hypothetical protein